MEPVIVDFGLATNADLEKYLFFRCGTPGYVAPEIIVLSESKHIEPKCDIFSAGLFFIFSRLEKLSLMEASMKKSTKKTRK